MKRDKFYQLLDQKEMDYDRELCDYGINVLKNYLLYISVVLVPAIYYHSVLEFVIFLLLYIPIRKNIGGIHLKRKSTCLLFSVLITLLIISFSKYSYYYGAAVVIFFHCVVILLLIMIKKFGCMEDLKKNLNKDEKKYFKNKSISIIILYYFLFLIANVFNISKVSSTIFCILLMFFANYMIWILKKCKQG